MAEISGQGNLSWYSLEMNSLRDSSDTQGCHFLPSKKTFTNNKSLHYKFLVVIYIFFSLGDDDNSAFHTQEAKEFFCFSRQLISSFYVLMDLLLKF